MPSISFTNFTKPDGSIDWDAYRKAQIANGDSCSECHTFILWGSKGYPERCNPCRQFDEDAEVEHSRSIRCPKCRHLLDPFEYESGIDLGEAVSGGGEQKIICKRCDTDFSVGIRVEFRFTSPPILEDGVKVPNEDV